MTLKKEVFIATNHIHLWESRKDSGPEFSYSRNDEKRYLRRKLFQHSNGTVQLYKIFLQFYVFFQQKLNLVGSSTKKRRFCVYLQHFRQVSLEKSKIGLICPPRNCWFHIWGNFKVSSDRDSANSGAQFQHKKSTQKRGHGVRAQQARFMRKYDVFHAKSIL